MSEPPPPNKSASESTRTIIFMVILSFACALILSVLASVLAEPKALAKDLDRSKQMMIAANILSHEGYFLMADSSGKTVPAKYSSGGILVPGTSKDIPTRSQIFEVYKKRLKPRLVNPDSRLTTFEEAGINEERYLADHKKNGYYKLPYKLIYEILPNSKGEAPASSGKEVPQGYVIPVNGYGLWDAIYGYLAIKPDGDTVIGITWYDQKETPGLGANIAEESWQKQFKGKRIFQESPDGKTVFKTAPLGINVVKGKVAEVLGDSPKAKSAVDGMAGATLTGNGVADAYRDVLAPHRTFLISLHDDYVKNHPP